MKPPGIWKSLDHKFKTYGTRQTPSLGCTPNSHGKPEKWQPQETTEWWPPPPVSSRSCSLNKNCISCHLHSSSVLIYRLHFDLGTLKHWLHADCCFRPPSAPRGLLQLKGLTDRPKYSVADHYFSAVCIESCPYCNILFSYAVYVQLNQVTEMLQAKYFKIILKITQTVGEGQKDKLKSRRLWQHDGVPKPVIRKKFVLRRMK